MGRRESYAPGTFCSVDLATTDADGAKSFYGGLFGWEGEDVHPAEGMTYTALRLDGDSVGGLFERDGLEASWRTSRRPRTNVTDDDPTRRPIPRPGPAYSYWSACSTFSRAARRAGKIAASSPATTAAITKTTIVPTGIVKAG